MTREYELMYIIRPDLDDEQVTAAVASVRSLIETNGGAVLKTTSWGKRRLAYEVKHLRDGYYMIVRCDLDAAKVKDIERALTIHDSVFRHLLTIAPDKTDPSQVQDEEFVATSEEGATTATAQEDGEEEREFALAGVDEEEE